MLATTSSALCWTKRLKQFQGRKCGTWQLALKEFLDVIRRGDCYRFPVSLQLTAAAYVLSKTSTLHESPHHLRCAQPRALGLKVSDEFTVPLCRSHHREPHQAGNEAAWWDKLKIDALRIARQFWEQRHASEATSETSRLN